jgi:hypothetical protein
MLCEYTPIYADDLALVDAQRFQRPGFFDTFHHQARTASTRVVVVEDGTPCA